MAVRAQESSPTWRTWSGRPALGSGTRRGTITLWCALACIALASTPQLLYIQLYGVNVPFWDQWDFIPLIKKSFNGSLRLSDLWAQYAEQRLFIPRLAMLLNAGLARYNIVVELYVTWLLNLVVAATILSFFGPACWPLRRRVAAFLPVALLLFSLRPWENLLWSWQVQRAFCMAFLVVSVALLSRSHTLGLGLTLAALSAAAASASLAPGLLAWPIGLVQMLLTRSPGVEASRAARVRMATAWLLCGGAVSGLYLWDYRQPVHPFSGTFPLEHPPTALAYFMVALGSPLATTVPLAGLAGVVFAAVGGTMLLLLLVRRRRLDGVAGAFATLTLLGLGDGLLLAVGRSGFGVDQAVASRYTAELALGWVGLYGLLLFGPWSASVGHKAVSGLVALGIIVGVVAAIPTALHEGRDTNWIQRKNAYYLQTYRLQDDANLSRLGPAPELVRSSARFLDQAGLSVFAAPVADVARLSERPGLAAAAVDGMNGQSMRNGGHATVSTARDPTITIYGWASDRLANAPAAGALVEIDAQTRIPAMRLLERETLTRLADTPPYPRTGFRAEFTTRLLSPGWHSLRVIVLAADGSSFDLHHDRYWLELVD